MVSSDTSRSTRRRCSPAREGAWTRGTALKVPGASSVRIDGSPASSPATSWVPPAERRTSSALRMSSRPWSGRRR
jgi:hypothetical protein